MIIKTMYATFGKLDEARLDLSEGMNVLYGENESGKSTWSAFLRVMLYGISTKERTKTGVMADKDKFLPWAGKPMYGKIEFSLDGKDYILERTSGKGKVLQDAKITEVETGKVLDIPEPVGETLLGIRREVFERTSFIGQAQIAVSGDKTGELEKRICALATTGEEDVSQKQVIDRLEREKRALKYNKRSGEILELEDELTKLNKTIDEAQREAFELTTLHTEIQALREKEERALGDIERAKVLEARRNLEYIKVAQNELEEARAELKSLEEQETVTPQQASEIEAKYKQYEEKMRIYTNCCERLDGESPAEQQEIPDGPGTKPVISAAICGLVSLALYFLIGLFAIPVAVLTFAVVYFAAVSAFYKKYGVKNRGELNLMREDAAKKVRTLEILQEDCARAKGECDAAEETLKAILNMLGGGYSVADVPQILENVREYQLKLKALSQKVETCTAKCDAVKVGRDIEELETLAEKSINDETPCASEEQLRTICTRAREESEVRARQLAALEERICARGELGALQARRSAVEEELAEKNKNYEALSLASQLITELQTELARKFAPTVEKAAAEIFGYLTGERFKVVNIENADMALSVAENPASPTRNILQLSGGTLDELYLSVRLALCEALLDKKVPIFLDDALVNFDDARVEKMLTLLKKLSNDRQIVVFSCHLREQEFAKRNNITGGTVK
ncbi:MAG: AAA family ATPase [Clostridia bacterium]|nr:AAA family ATPase [Clostridia bacterium]